VLTATPQITLAAGHGPHLEVDLYSTSSIDETTARPG
jgi:hypothetical protein